MEISLLDDAVAFITKDGSTIRELAGPRTLPSPQQSLAEAMVPVGGATQEHHHVVSQEIYYFTAGAGRLRVGDEYRDVHAGHCVVIAPGLIHGIVNTSDEPLRLMCCCAPPYSDADTVLADGACVHALSGTPASALVEPVEDAGAGR